jgi:hypothetical protein
MENFSYTPRRIEVLQTYLNCGTSEKAAQKLGLSKRGIDANLQSLRNIRQSSHRKKKNNEIYGCVFLVVNDALEKGLVTLPKPNARIILQTLKPIYRDVCYHLLDKYMHMIDVYQALDRDKRTVDWRVGRLYHTYGFLDRVDLYSALRNIPPDDWLACGYEKAPGK